MGLKKHKNNFKNIYFISILTNYIFKVVNKNNYMLEFYDKKIVSLFYILSKHYNIQLKVFIDLVTIDVPTNEARFQNIYNCLSVIFTTRIILKTFITEFNSIESIINIFNNSNWYERESWDLFGIFYINHTDLRRLLNDYNYKGHPLRKNFPLIGFFELKYSYIKKNIICKDISTLYKYRFYTNKFNWKYI